MDVSDVAARGRILLVLAAVLALIVTATAAAAGPRAPGGEFMPVIVVFEDDVTSPDAAAAELMRQYGGQLSFVYAHALKGFAAAVPVSAADALAGDRRVAYVEHDQEVALFDHVEGELPSGVDRIEADQKLALTGDSATGETVGVGVAVIDTGIQLEHSDLNVVGGTNCSGGGPFNRSCDDGHGGEDDHGHGTHVAGTIGAFDDGAGVVGVAPGADLYAVKVLRKDGSGYMSWIIAGIDWVTAQAGTISVANMSLGCECSSSALDDAIDASTEAGVVYVVAAGNSGKDAATFSPAKHPRVITVAAIADFDGMAGSAHAPTCRDDVGGDDEFATFSNYGDAVEFAAPGVCINSTWLDGGYRQASGTSMASPHGAGAAALYIIENGIAKASDRWQTVRNGIVSDWTVAATHDCGYNASTHPTPDAPEPLLMLVTPCEIAGVEPVATGMISGTVTETDGTTTIGGATVAVDGTTLSATSDADNGTYTIDGVPVGSTHSVTASAEGYESQTVENVEVIENQETTGVDFDLKAAATVSVAEIAYSTRGGNRHLDVTLSVVDGDGSGVAGATVEARLFLDSNVLVSFTGQTNSEGTLTVSVMNAPSGCYTTTVDNVTADGLAWDEITPENIHCK